LNDLTGLFNPKDHKCRAKDFDISWFRVWLIIQHSKSKKLH
jgi:hypothetical protein